MPVWKKRILHRISHSDNRPIGWMFWCPGCENGHAIYVEEPNDYKAQWTFNGDVEHPTFSPSILCFSIDPQTHARKTLCHSFVENGQIRFLDDCVHKLAGQTVPLQPF